ncbi:MAG TPA: RsmB/NOP family class I SAM-dependent RNA methyltransferase [Candidatus Saccharimonadales bacterium]|nr:RsmB/NOP family class I SAM-dependent RNA methyltransferase [Candidatus Saccharimonadales bacterium]
MSKTPAEKRTIWIERTATALHLDETQAATLLRMGRTQSLRLNPLAGDKEATLQALQALGWEGEQYDWMQDGYTVTSPLATIRDSQLVTDGKVFIQNAASWLPVLALDPQPGQTVLDVCAAPGGKTSHIAALTTNQAAITANDNSRPRLAKMRANFARLHVQNVELTLYDATQLARKLDGLQFDKILLDAPCSGEGLMQLDRDKDFAMWSVAQIKRLQHLQKKVLGQAWQLLKPGGTLVYSTCTMAPEENEAVIDYLLRTHDDAEVVPIALQLPNRVPPVQSWNGKSFSPAVQNTMRLTPSDSTEAFFVCKLHKKETA